MFVAHVINAERRGKRDGDDEFRHRVEWIINYIIACYCADTNLKLFYIASYICKT